MCMSVGGARVWGPGSGAGTQQYRVLAKSMGEKGKTMAASQTEKKKKQKEGAKKQSNAVEEELTGDGKENQYN
eukprot:13346203-Ditylum_brightwellii.AAC.1